MHKEHKKFIIVNSLIVILALIGAVFKLPGIYATLFAVSVAYQISYLKRIG